MEGAYVMFYLNRKAVGTCPYTQKRKAITITYQEISYNKSLLKSYKAVANDCMDAGNCHQDCCPIMKKHLYISD